MKVGPSTPVTASHPHPKEGLVGHGCAGHWSDELIAQLCDELGFLPHGVHVPQ